MKAKLAQRLLNVLTELVTAESTDAFREGSGSGTDVFEIDKKLNHRKAELLAPIDWLHENGLEFRVIPSNEDFRDNIIWANILWLLDSAGLLKERLIWNHPLC
jgi:hypothetical protein